MPALVKRHPMIKRRSFWTPTFLESLVGCVLLAAWIVAMIIIIRHEEAGILLSVVYLLVGLIGAAVSWLLLWPLLRIIMRT